MATNIPPYEMTSYWPRVYSQQPGHVTNGFVHHVNHVWNWPYLVVLAALLLFIRRVWLVVGLACLVGLSATAGTYSGGGGGGGGGTITVTFTNDWSVPVTIGGYELVGSLTFTTNTFAGTVLDPNQVWTGSISSYSAGIYMSPQDGSGLTYYGGVGVYNTDALSIHPVPESSTSSFFFTGGGTLADFIYTSLRSPFALAVTFSIGAIATFVCIRWIRRAVVQQRIASDHSDRRKTFRMMENRRMRTLARKARWRQ